MPFKGNAEWDTKWNYESHVYCHTMDPRRSSCQLAWQPLRFGPPPPRLQLFASVQSIVTGHRAGLLRARIAPTDADQRRRSGADKSHESTGTRTLGHWARPTPTLGHCLQWVHSPRTKRSATSHLPTTGQNLANPPTCHKKLADPLPPQKAVGERARPKRQTRILLLIGEGN